MTVYRRKPVDLVGVLWTGDNVAEMQEFCGFRLGFGRLFIQILPSLASAPGEAQVYDVLHDTWITLYPGAVVMQGVRGELYPVAQEVLSELYDELPEEERT